MEKNVRKSRCRRRRAGGEGRRKRRGKRRSRMRRRGVGKEEVEGDKKANDSEREGTPETNIFSSPG